MSSRRTLSLLSHKPTFLLAVLASALIVSGLSVPTVVAPRAYAEQSTVTETLDSDHDGDADRPDTTSASMAARQAGKRVEDLSQRTATTQVFANSDGTWTKEVAAGPVRAQDAETGAWSPIDTTLVRDGSSWRPQAALGQISFSDGGGGPLVTMSGLKDKDLSWTWPTPLLAPTVDGSTLTYHDAVPDGDLVVTALPDGFSHSVVLRKAPTKPLELPMVVETDGAKLRVSDDGSIGIGPSTAPLVSAPTPTMWDSSSTSDETRSAAQIAVSSHVESTGGRKSLVLTPDPEFLSSPDTVYPVTIDPSYTTHGVVMEADTTLGYAYSAGDTARIGFEHEHRYGMLIDFGGTLGSGNNLIAPGTIVHGASLSLYNSATASCDDRDIDVFQIVDSWDSYADTADIPAVTSAGYSTATQTGCGPTGWETWDVTQIAQAWVNGADRFGVMVVPTDTNEGNYHDFDVVGDYGANPDPRVTRHQPILSIGTDDPPYVAAPPVPSDSSTYAGQTYVRTGTPSWSTSATDVDLGNVRYHVEVRSSADVNAAVLASCQTGYVASGQQSSCTPPTSLANGTYFVRASADDGELTGSWSGWRQVTVNYDPPEPVEVSCTGAADQHWYAPPPAASTACTFASPGAVQLEWTLNGVAQMTLSANASGTATKTGIAIPASGWTSIKVRGVSNAGMASEWSEYAFGTGPSFPAAGTAWLTSPVDGASSATTFQVGASAPSGMNVGVLQWRAGATDTWTPATEVYTDSGDVWDGHVDDNTHMSSTPRLTWRPTAESGMTIPGSVQVRMHFVRTLLPYDSQPVTLTIAAHAAGAAAPTADVGPGSVQLGTGEFEMSASDVSIASMAVSRAHLSNADAATGARGIFGPGWDASIGVGGAATFKVTDQRATNASLLFTTPDGTTYTFRSTSPAASNLSGDFAPIGDAKALGDTVTLNGTSNVLSYTEAGATTTTFEKTAGRWVPTTTVGAGTESTTSYYYDSNGLPTWVIAPAPTGITCTPTSLPAGCQALHLTYTAVSGAQRVTSIAYKTWDPLLNDADGDAGNDGLPDGGGAITETTVAKYTYNTDGTLQAVWDPRVADGTSALKTTYTYAISGTKTRLATITPPGLKPWQITYDSDGAVTTITRQQDAAVGTGNATWTVKYGIKLNAESAGLPNLSAAKTAAWGQPAADAPETGAAVFGPNRVPAAAPTATDWTYAGLYYWNSAGRLTNTAVYSTAWQIASTRYDSVGNEIWSLTPAARNQAITDGADNAANSAAAADRYATFTVYNSSGDRVEAEYGPMTTALTKAGTQLTLRPLTVNVYDDEASWLAYGRPTTIPEGGFNLAVETVLTSTDEATPGTWATAGWNTSSNATGAPSTVHLYDTTQTRYRYDPQITGDVSGWTLHQPTAILLQNGSSWDKSTTTYDTAGRVVRQQTPEGVATGQQTRTHDTVYYTADTAASRSECRSKPQWAGLTCWEGPHGQPTTGQPIPATTYTGYSRALAATRSVTTSGTATKTSTTQYDGAGRQTRTATTTSGTTDQAVPATTIAYSSTTGLATTVSNGTMTMTTSYDTWGRATSQTDGAGNTATTTYNAAGQVATLNDGKATYSYTYDQTNAISGSGDRRGMVTALDTGIAGTTLAGVYDANGNLTKEQIPGASVLTQSWSRDVAGNLRGINFAFSGFFIPGWDMSQQLDAFGRARIASEPGRQATYAYDDRGRLIQVNDQKTTGTNTGCQVRKYTLTADSNRTSLASYAPGTGGALSDDDWYYQDEYLRPGRPHHQHRLRPRRPRPHHHRRCRRHYGPGQRQHHGDLLRQRHGRLPHPGISQPDLHPRPFGQDLHHQQPHQRRLPDRDDEPLHRHLGQPSLDRNQNPPGCPLDLDHVMDPVRQGNRRHHRDHPNLKRHPGRQHLQHPRRPRRHRQPRRLHHEQLHLLHRIRHTPRQRHQHQPLWVARQVPTRQPRHRRPYSYGRPPL